MLQPDILLVVRGPKPNTIFKVQLGTRHDKMRKKKKSTKEKEAFDQ